MFYSDINVNCARNDRTTRGRIYTVTLGRSIRLKVGSLHFIVMPVSFTAFLFSKANGLFPLPDSDSDSDTDSCTIQILWERDPNLNPSQWKHVLHNTM